MACFVKDCKNHKRFCREVSFHRFPKIDERRKQWLSAIGREDENLSKGTVRFVCSLHFAKDDFVAGNTLHILKRSAVPRVSVRESVDMAIPSTLRDIDNSTDNIQSSSDSECALKTKRKKFKVNTVSDEELKSSTLMESPLSFLTTSEIKQISANIVSSNERTKSGTDSSIIRKRKRVKLEHSYVVSPRTSKKRSQEIVLKHKQQQRKFYKARENVKRLKKRVTSLKNVLNNLKSKELRAGSKNAKSKHRSVYLYLDQI